MTQFNDIADDEVASVAEQLAQVVERTDYNVIAKYYNTKKVGGIFHFEFPRTKLSSLKKQLEMRGLVLDKDVSVAVRPIGEEKDAPTHAFLRRITDKEATMLQIKVGRRKKGEGGESEGGEGGEGGEGTGAKKEPAKPADKKPAPGKGAVTTGGKKK
jgi:hypothetical protein